MQSHAPRPKVPAGSLILIFTLMFASMVVMTPAAEQRPAPEGLTAMELRCEMRNDPLGIESTAPRLSWIIQSPARGERQVAYHVLAATSRELLQPARADLWDSGRRESDQSIHVEYAGKPLRSGQRVFWLTKRCGRPGGASRSLSFESWSVPGRPVNVRPLCDLNHPTSSARDVGLSIRPARNVANAGGT